MSISNQLHQFIDNSSLKRIKRVNNQEANGTITNQIKKEKHFEEKRSKKNNTQTHISRR